MDSVIIYASFGEGHKKAAFSLRESFHYPCIDLLDFSPAYIRNLYSFLYLFVTNYLPSLWHFIFYSSRNSFARFIAEKIQQIIFSSFRTYLKDNKPKVIVLTHFFPLPFIEYFKKMSACKVIVIVTDLRVHPIWTNDCVDMYYVAVDAGKNDLINLGVLPEKIISGYIPLRKGFVDRVSQEHLMKKFALTMRPSLFFISSLRGKFPLFKRLVFSLQKDSNIFVIYGKNTRLKRFLEKTDTMFIRFFSFYEEIWELFDLSKIIITKPGGLTVFEGLYKRKQFIFTHYIPGQEKENMDLLIQYGLAKFVKTEREFIEAIHDFRMRESEIRQNYPIQLDDIFPVLKQKIDMFLTA